MTPPSGVQRIMASGMFITMCSSVPKTTLKDRERSEISSSRVTGTRRDRLSSSVIMSATSRSFSRRLRTRRDKSSITATTTTMPLRKIQR